MHHLAAELAELLTRADSRLWRTLRRLALDPAGLTRDCLIGRRVSQVPPLRLFFVILVALFAAGSLSERGAVVLDIPPRGVVQIEHGIDRLATGAPRLDAWLKPHLRRAVERPDTVLEVMRDWLERFILLMLPIAAALLWVLCILVRPRFSFFDHLMHSLSFAAPVMIAVFLCGMVAEEAGLLLLLPIHLFRHMRGLYGGGAAAILVRMVLLGLGSGLAVIVLLLALTWVGLQFGAG